MTLLLAVFVTGLFAVDSAHAGSWKRASARNKRNCLKWCGEHSPPCEFCSTTRHCGIGYKKMKIWDGYGRNWSACEDTRYSKASAAHKAACNEYCDDVKKHTSKECKCDTKRFCGVGWKQVASWTGYGRNWHACEKNAYGLASDANYKACMNWCHEHNLKLGYRDCMLCSKYPWDYLKYKVLKTWKGTGRNWHACAFKNGTTWVGAKCSFGSDGVSNCKPTGGY